MSAAVSGPISAPQGVEAVPLPAAASPDVAAKYRGAVVEDMQPGPAVCVFRDATIDRALVVAHDHDYSQLPLVSKERKLLGYVDVAQLQDRVRKGLSQPSDRVDGAMVKFRASSDGKSRYHVITPQTDLADLEGAYFPSHLDAMLPQAMRADAAPAFLKTQPFAFVTDAGRAFVLGVVTREDLDKWVERRAGGGGVLDERENPMLAVREEEEARKNRSMAELVRTLDDYTPLIPDEVTDFYLERAGFESDDLRLKRLISLAAEKFVSDIAEDAYHYARIRSSAGPGARPKSQAAARDRSRTVLTMDDLSTALSEWGVNARRAEFFR